MKVSALQRNRIYQMSPAKPLIAARLWARALRALPMDGGGDKRFDWGNSSGYDFLASKLFYFFLEAEFAAFQFGDFQAIDEGARHFRFDLAMDGFVLFSKFLDMRKKAHFPASIHVNVLSQREHMSKR
jgi:hypothetical protein